MRKKLLLSLLCGTMLLPVTVLARLTPTTCGTGWGNAPESRGRCLNVIAVQVSNSEFDTPITGMDSQLAHAVYNDCTNEVVEAYPGATMKVYIPTNSDSFDEYIEVDNMMSSWMHGYLYIDYNNDGSFSYEVGDDGIPSANSELTAYSYYMSKNSKGEKIDDEGLAPNWSNMPDFTLPADLAKGDYRIRFKVDWNSLDPCGNSYANELITANGGYIIDFTLRIGDYNAIDEVKGDNTTLYYNKGQIYSNGLGEVAIYNIAGKLVKRTACAPVAVDNLPGGVYLVKANGKTMKFVK